MYLHRCNLVREVSIPLTFPAKEQPAERARVQTKRTHRTSTPAGGPKKNTAVLSRKKERPELQRGTYPKQIPENEKQTTEQPPKRKPDAPRAGKNTRHYSVELAPAKIKLSRHPKPGIECVHQAACLAIRSALPDRTVQLRGERALEAHRGSPACASDAADYLSGFLHVQAWRWVGGWGPRQTSSSGSLRKT